MDAVMAVKRGGAPGADACARGRCRARPRERRAPAARAADETAARTTAGALRRRHRQPGADAAVLGRPGRQGHRRWPTTPPARRARDVHGPVGAARRPRRQAARRTRSWSRPRAGRGCATGWTGCRPTSVLEAGRRLRLLPVRAARATTWSCSTTTAAPSGPGSPSRASAATGACAWPTSSGRASPARLDVVAFQLVTMGQRISESPRSCSPRTPTATTSSCTACRCS